MGRMANIDARRLIRALGRLGWTVERTRGGLFFLKKPGAPSTVVPVHPGRPLKPGTARAILQQVGLSEDQFFDLY